MPERIVNKLGVLRAAELLHEAGLVGGYGLDGEIEFVSNGRERIAVHDEFEDFLFTRRELGAFGAFPERAVDEKPGLALA